MFFVVVPVKPRPVQKLAVKSLTSRSMVISWEQPDKLDWDWFEMVFRVSYESQWEEGQKVGGCMVHGECSLGCGVSVAVWYTESVAWGVGSL